MIKSNLFYCSQVNRIQGNLRHLATDPESHGSTVFLRFLLDAAAASAVAISHHDRRHCHFLQLFITKTAIIDVIAIIAIIATSPSPACPSVRPCLSVCLPVRRPACLHARLTIRASVLLVCFHHAKAAVK